MHKGVTYCHLLYITSSFTSCIETDILCMLMAILCLAGVMMIVF